MASMVDEVATYLAAQGVGTVKTASNDPAWPIYTAGLQEGTKTNPHDAIGLIEGVGESPQDEMGATVGAVIFENPSLVVQVRSRSAVTARTKAEACWAKLHKFVGTLSGTRYLLMQARQSPMPIGRDDGDRWIFGFNVGVSKERS